MEQKGRKGGLGLKNPLVVDEDSLESPLIVGEKALKSPYFE